MNGVEDVISVPSAVNLVKMADQEKLNADTIFPAKSLTQAEIDSSKKIFLNLPFYKDRLYNPETNVWLMGIRINKDVINSEKRNQ